MAHGAMKMSSAGPHAGNPAALGNFGCGGGDTVRAAELADMGNISLVLSYDFSPVQEKSKSSHSEQEPVTENPASAMLRP